jgi:hypothetical protein
MKFPTVIRGEKLMSTGLRLRCLLFLIGSILFLGGCTDPNYEFIQGAWHFIHRRVEVGHQPGPDVQYWIFSGGTYSNYSCCIHEDSENGKYRVTDSDETSITIELYDTVGSSGGNEDRVIKIVINREFDTLKFGNMELIRGMP